MTKTDADAVERAMVWLADQLEHVRNGIFTTTRQNVEATHAATVIADLVAQRDALQAKLDALTAGRVKALEWRDHGDEDPIVQSRADTLLGTYFICDDADDFTGFYLELVSHDNAKWWQHVRSTCETLVENHHDDDLTPLKAAAQADYERRILSALTPAPKTYEDGVREFVQELADTEWQEAEPASGWCPEEGQRYVEEMEAFCNYAVNLSRALLKQEPTT